MVCGEDNCPDSDCNTKKSCVIAAVVCATTEGGAYPTFELRMGKIRVLISACLTALLLDMVACAQDVLSSGCDNSITNNKGKHVQAQGLDNGAGIRTHQALLLLSTLPVRKARMLWLWLSPPPPLEKPKHSGRHDPNTQDNFAHHGEPLQAGVCLLLHQELVSVFLLEELLSLRKVGHVKKVEGSRSQFLNMPREGQAAFGSIFA